MLVVTDVSTRRSQLVAYGTNCAPRFIAYRRIGL
jgi:hypothetical protein